MAFSAQQCSRDDELFPILLSRQKQNDVKCRSKCCYGDCTFSMQHHTLKKRADFSQSNDFKSLGTIEV